jgi:hypothetical protein
MTALKDHKYMSRALIGLYALGALLVSEVIPDINSFLELVPLPSDSVRSMVLLYLVADTAAVATVEWLIRKGWNGRV